MDLRDDDQTPNGWSTGRRRFIGATAAGAAGLWAAPQVMSSAGAAVACSSAPLSVTLTTTTGCGQQLSSVGQNSGQTPQDSLLLIEGCTGCAAGPVDTFLTAYDAQGNLAVERLPVDSYDSTGGCSEAGLPADLFNLGPGARYVGVAEYREQPDVNASLSWEIVIDCP